MADRNNQYDDEEDYTDGDYDEHTLDYEEQTYNESEEQSPPPAPAPAPARPPHPLFGGAGAKSELLMAANKMSKERTNEAGAPPGASAKAASATTSFRPPTNDAAPRPPPPGGNDMAAQIAMLAQKRAQRMSTEGDAAIEPPPPRQPQESKPPVITGAQLRKTAPVAHENKPPIFASAQLRKTAPVAAAAPVASREIEEQEQPEATNKAYTQSKLRAAEDGVDTRAAPQQDRYDEEDQKEEEPLIPAPVPIDNDGVFPAGTTEEYYSDNPQYERVLLSRQEPEIVTTHKVMSSEPEYEIIEYRICCTIL